MISMVVPENVRTEVDISMDSSEKAVVNKTRERVFQAILAHGGQFPEDLNSGPVADLQKPIDEEVELHTKKGAVEARDVALEQERIVYIIKDKFEYLQEGKNLDEYCEKLSIGGGVKEDLRSAIPQILNTLSNPIEDIFRGKMEVQDYQDELIYGFLKGELGASMVRGSAEFNQAIENIINTEIDLALFVLSESRKYPVLAHRVRGFSEDEASERGLQEALEKGVAEIEFDIRKSKDGKAIIHHNATLGASCGRSESIHDLTAGELYEIPMKNNPDNHIIALRRFFDMLEETGNQVTKVNIDIKDYNPEMLDEILDLIQQHKAHHRVVIVSWLPQALQYLYEKDPTLSYSMSYFPVLDTPVVSPLIKAVSRLPSGSRLFGKFATWFAKRRSKKIQEGMSVSTKDTLSENISDAVVLDANQHYSKMESTLEEERGGRELIGAHTIPVEKPPRSITESDPDKKDIMARVLHNGSVNVMAIPEKTFHKKFIPKQISKWLSKWVLGKKIKLAKECEKNDIKFNSFDLVDTSEIKDRSDEFREEGLDPGVIYSSNPDALRHLGTK